MIGPPVYNLSMIGKIVFAGLLLLEIVLVGFLVNAGDVRVMNAWPFLASILNLVPIIVMSISMLIGISPQSNTMDVQNFVNLQQIRRNTDK